MGDDVANWHNFLSLVHICYLSVLKNPRSDPKYTFFSRLPFRASSTNTSLEFAKLFDRHCTVSSSTNCYVAAASVTACGRKRRAIEYIDDEVRGVFGPSSPRWWIYLFNSEREVQQGLNCVCTCLLYRCGEITSHSSFLAITTLWVVLKEIFRSVFKTTWK